MATDPETNQKLPLNRRDAMRVIAFGAAGVTLAIRDMTVSGS